MARLNQGQRRARAKLIWAASLFVAAQLLAGLLLEHVWPWVRFPDAEKVLSAAAVRPERADLVFLGSSRFETGLDVCEIGTLLERQQQLPRACGVLNAAVPACDPFLAEFLVDQLLEAGVQPRCLVLEMSPELLSRYHNWLGFHLIRLLRWEDLPARLPDVVRTGNVQHLLCWRLLPVLLHRQQILQHFGLAPELSGMPPRYNLGADTVDRPANLTIDMKKLLCLPACDPPPGHQEAIRQALAHNTPRRWLLNYRIDGGANAAALERLLGRCRQQGIRVLLVGVPVTETHRQTWTPPILAAYHDYLSRVCAAYGCTFVSCHDWLPDGLFRDNHHVSEAGKRYFSRLLALRVLAPLCPDDASTSASAPASP